MKLTLTITPELEKKISSYRDSAKESTSDHKAAAVSVETASIYLLTFAADEQIRRFDKAKSDAIARHVAAAKSALADALSEAIASGDFAKAKALTAEFAKVTK